MPRILHITSDFGDRIEPDKTKAIANLVGADDRDEHVVFSLNRTVDPRLAGRREREDNVYSLNYHGLPGGVGLRRSLENAAEWLIELVGSEAIDADVVHAHKLTFEGPIARRIAAARSVPYVCTIRGDTDLKVLKYKPTYRRWYRTLFGEAGAAFFLAPWTERAMHDLWPRTSPGRSELLPNIVELPPAVDVDEVDASRLVSVFHLKDYRRKNLVRMLEAIDRCRDDGLDVKLDIVGGGSASVTERVSKIVARRRHPGAIRLLGQRDRAALASLLPRYAGLVGPSIRETFGMVYLEALQCGIPFLQSRNTGLDGYFDAADVCATVDPTSATDIAAGIRYLVVDGERLRKNIAALKASGGLEPFAKAQIVRTYSTTIAGVVAAYRDKA